MQYPVSSLIAQVNFPPISEVWGWLRELAPSSPLIDLCQAVPDYAPAPELIEHLKPLLDNPLTSRYAPDEGLPEVLKSVCARYARVYGGEINPSQLCLTIGASQAFWLALVTLCRPDDEVIIPVPYYFDHAMALDMLGIRSRYLPFNAETGGIPSAASIMKLITKRTRAILLVSPCNPTGMVTPPEVIHELQALAREHGIALIIDETYADFIPGGLRPHDLFSLREWGRNLIHIMSFGKTYALTGYRAGCIAGSEEFIHHALKVQDTMAVCQPRITQYALKFAVENLDQWVADNRDMISRRHDLFRNSFRRPGNPFRLIASGTFFAWIEHPFKDRTGRETAYELLKETGLMLLPGEVFGQGMESYLRVAFGNIREEAIPEAVERFRNFEWSKGM